MAYFEWADDMTIDGGPIDEDHMQLVRLVNDLHSATSEGCGHEVVERILTELLSYTQEHLRREEQMMANLRIPNTDRHRQGQADFSQKLKDFQQRYLKGSIAVPSQLSTLLRDWLSLHIRRSDKELKAYFKATTATPTRKP